MRVLLVDGDMVAYRNAAAVEDGKEIDWGDGVVSTLDTAAVGRNRIDKFLGELAATLKADKVEVCLSYEPSFRQGLNTGYKTNRNDKQRPALLSEFKQYLVDHHGAERMPGLEADDMMGIKATNPDNEEFDRETVVVSIDKDLRQIPGLLYNPFPSTRKPVLEEITPDQGDYFFMYQTLTGDATDGYKGCPGVGPVKAKEALDEAVGESQEFRKKSKCSFISCLWPMVVHEFAVRGLTEADALVQARMARILRFEDWSPESGVKLWTPPS